MRKSSFKWFFRFFYILPAIVTYFFSYEYRTWAHREFGLAFLAILILAILFVETLILKFPTIRFKRYNFSTIKYDKFVVVLFSLFAIYYINNFSIDFRYSGTDISSSPAIMIFSALKVIIKYIIFTDIFYNHLSRNIKWLLILSWIITVNGTLELVILSLYLIIVTAPNIITKHNSLKLALILIPVSLGIILFGFLNKIGINRADELFALYGEVMLYTTYERLATYFLILNNYLIDWWIGNTPFLIALELDYFLENLSKLTNIGINLSDPWSINRYGWNLIALGYHDTAGASPGMVASFYMSGILAPFIIFYFLLIRDVVIAFGNKLRFNFLGQQWLIMALWFPLTLSPLSGINIISIAGIDTFFSLWFIGRINL